VEVKDKIKERRTELGLTLEQVGNYVGVSKSTVKKWESGSISNMRRDKIAKLSEVLRISPVELMGWQDEPTPPTPTPFPASNLQPMFGTKASPRLGDIPCGEPALAEQHFEGMDIVPDFVDADFTLQCHGDSMINARIFDGDIVCIRQQETVENGEIAAVLVDGEEATLKRVHIYPDHIVLEPENPKYRPLPFWEEDMNRVRILGKATYFISHVR